MSNEEIDEQERDIEEHVRRCIAKERERCIAIMRRYLQFNDQRAVSWHEVNDAIDAIRKDTR